MEGMRCLRTEWRLARRTIGHRCSSATAIITIPHISIRLRLSSNALSKQHTSWRQNSLLQYTLLFPSLFRQILDPQPLSTSKQKPKISSLNYSISPLTQMPSSRSMAKDTRDSESKSIPSFLHLISSSCQESLLASMLADHG